MISSIQSVLCFLDGRSLWSDWTNIYSASFLFIIVFKIKRYSFLFTPLKNALHFVILDAGEKSLKKIPLCDFLGYVKYGLSKTKTVFCANVSILLSLIISVYMHMRKWLSRWRQDLARLCKMTAEKELDVFQC